MTTTFAEAVPVTPSEASEPFVLLRAGRYVKSGRTIEITIADLDRAVANFEFDRSAGIEIPWDFDHSHAKGRGSKSAGKLRSLTRRGDELIATAEWTEEARAAIERGEYHAPSAEFAPDHATEHGLRRGFAILAAALTSRPFIRDLRVAFTADRPGVVATFTAAERMDELDALIEGGDFDLDAVRHALRVERIAFERDVDYETAAAAAWKEMR